MNEVVQPDWAERLRLILHALDRPTSEINEEVSSSGDEGWLSEALAGHVEPTYSQYAALSVVANIPLAVLTGSVPMERNFAVARRAGLLCRDDDVEDVTGRAQSSLDDLELLLSWFPQQREERAARLATARRACSGNSYALKAGQQTAEAFRDIFQIGDDPIFDLSALVEDLGVPVIIEPMARSLHGITVRDESGRSSESVVLINSIDWWGRQRFTLAHELCHVLFGDGGALIVNHKEVSEGPDLVEYRADVFARHLLAPSRAVRTFWKSAAPTSHEQVARTLATFMLHFGLSRQASILALNDVCKLDESILEPFKVGRIDELMLSVGLEQSWEEACRQQDEPAPSRWLVSMALDAYGAGLIRSDIVASVLGRPDVTGVERELLSEGWAPQPA